MHRLIRQRHRYGPELQKVCSKTDGADRGLMFAFVGTQTVLSSRLSRPSGSSAAPLLGSVHVKDRSSGEPRRLLVLESDDGRSPKLHGLSRFVVTRGW